MVRVYSLPSLWDLVCFICFVLGPDLASLRDYYWLCLLKSLLALLCSGTIWDTGVDIIQHKYPMLRSELSLCPSLWDLLTKASIGPLVHPLT